MGADIKKWSDEDYREMSLRIAGFMKQDVEVAVFDTLPICPHDSCAYHVDCMILAILKKAPKPGRKCSYFEDDKSSKARKLNKSADESI